MRIAKRLWAMGACTAIFAGLLLGGCKALEEEEEAPPPGEPSDITVDKLCEKMSAATDPQGLYKNASSYEMRQSMLSVKKLDKDVEEIEVKFQKPAFMKCTVFKNNKPIAITLFDGENAWNIDPDNQSNSPVPQGTRLNLVRAFADLGMPWKTLKDIFDTIDISIVTLDDGKKYYRLICKVKDPQIAAYIIYVGKNDYLTRRLETTLYKEDGSKQPYVSTIGRYTVRSGVKVALETAVETGSSTDTSTLVSFTLNPKFPDDEFKLPVPWYLTPGDSKDASPSSKDGSK
jgi:outer membrane lipoprotein-sorting protein